MIYELKEILKRDTSLSVINYICEQISELLGKPIEQTLLYELSCTTHFFVSIGEGLEIKGIIIISCKSFAFGDKMFFIESLCSKTKRTLIEQSLLLRGISHIVNISKNIKLNNIVSLVVDERIQKLVLNQFGFIQSQNILVKI